LLYKAANVGRGVKITSPKGNGYVLKIAAQKNIDSKLKNGQHADKAINAALARFSFYKRLTAQVNSSTASEVAKLLVGLLCVFVSTLLRVAY
jgi:hypothetical protein